MKILTAEEVKKKIQEKIHRYLEQSGISGKFKVRVKEFYRSEKDRFPA